MARETAMGYVGPTLLAYNAWLAKDDATRDDPDMIEDQCAKLASFYWNEARPLGKAMPLADFLVRRGRVFATALRGNPSPEMAAEAKAPAPCGWGPDLPQRWSG